jgi:hypothetical protein
MTASKNHKPYRRHNSIIDENLLYRNLHCSQCQKKTQHIYCRSLNPKPIGHMCYACLECGKEKA